MAGRLGALIVFPTIARFAGEHQAAADRVRRKRGPTLALVALAMGVAIAGADGVILLLYDPRYQSAAFMLPVLLLGVWFGTLAAFSESVLLGCDRPAPIALANGAKFAILAAGLPLAFPYGGLLLSLLVLALAECGRWLVLGRALVREKLAFFGDDLALTLLLIGTAALTKLALGELGIFLDFTEWWALGSEVL